MTIATRSLAGLSLDEKRELLARLLREKAEQSAVSSRSPTASAGSGSSTRWTPRAPRTTSVIRRGSGRRWTVPAFRRAVQKLVDRHAGLRTTFEESGGELRQRVHDKPPLPLEVIDASSWSEEELRRRLDEESHRPFDLERGPLVRMHLFRRAHGRSHLPAERPPHHRRLLVAGAGARRDAGALSRPIATAGPRRCRPRRGEYRDFVRWQAELLAGPEGDRLWAYWQRQLAGAPTVLDLPTDRPRPPVFTRRGGAVPWRLAPDLVRRLKALAATRGRPRSTPCCWRHSRCSSAGTPARKISSSAARSPAGAAPDSRT